MYVGKDDGLKEILLKSAKEVIESSHPKAVFQNARELYGKGEGSDNDSDVVKLAGRILERADAIKFQRASHDTQGNR